MNMRLLSTIVLENATTIFYRLRENTLDGYSQKKSMIRIISEKELDQTDPVEKICLFGNLIIYF